MTSITRPQLPLFLFSFFIQHSAVAAISPGSTLYASNPNRTWSSPSSTFSLGFVPNPSQVQPSSFVAAITYSGGTAVVWSIPAAVDYSGSLHFVNAGELRLVSGSGSTVWSSNTTGRGVTSATLDDSGNLVLRSANSTVWSSFDHPTDVIVPFQNFTAGKVLTNGLYSFTLLGSGNLTLTWNESIVYWNQGPNVSVELNLTSPTLKLESTGILSLSDPSFASDAILYFSSDYGEGSDVLRFLKLDPDGNLRIYSSVKGSGTLDLSWAAVQDQCRVFGFCGNWGICSYNDSNPVCTCPSLNFELIDPNDSKKGCKRTVEIEDCPGNATMLKLHHALFLTYPTQLASQMFTLGISACRANCLVSASCVASTSLSDGSGLCYMKTPEYLSGYQNPTLSSTSYVKVCAPEVPNPTSVESSVNNIGWSGWTVAIVVLTSNFGLLLVEVGLWLWCTRNRTRFGDLSPQYAFLEYASGAPVKFTYKELQRATSCFKEQLGAGGFGAVYRGVLANRTVVAVKQLEGIQQGEKQFRAEVATISSTHHLNLARLIGFCSEGRRRLLVYEFMKNGSLDNFLFPDSDELQSGKYLNWEHRFSIALGTARGIAYLHEECRDCIIHCDIKPENILLDERYNPMVSDFGLAKLIHPQEHWHQTLKSVRGTRGYLAPEWLSNFQVTSKSDVYSYGMVLLEIVSGRRNFEVSFETNQKKFSQWAYEEVEMGNVECVMDKRLRANLQDVNMEQVMRALQVSFWCIQEQPSHRPTMGKVVQMLEGIIPIERPPAPKTVIEGSVSLVPTFAPAAPAGSSFSSVQTTGASSLASHRNSDKGSLRLLSSEFE